MSSFLVCVKSADRPWEIDSWHDAQAVAEYTATQLVTRPYMEQAACVVEVIGTSGIPHFEPVFQVKGKGQL